MADNLIDNFLVAVGWKIDEASFKKQRDLVNMTREQQRQHEKEERERERAEQQRERDRQRRLEGTIVRANLFASAIEGVSKTVVRSVASIASSFEVMFYASQRTGQSVQSLKSMAYAVSQLGGSYDAALQSAENFARNLRDNPGYEAMLNQLGVKTRGASGDRLGAKGVIADFVQKSKSMPYHLARSYAADLGFDEGTFLVMRQQTDELARFEAQYNKTARAFGLDNEKAQRGGKELAQSLRGLSETGSVLAQKFYSDLAPSLTRIVDRFQAWIDTHPEQINAVLEIGERVVMAFAHAAEWLGDKIGPVIVQIGDWAKSITGKNGLQDSLDTFAKWLIGIWAVKVVAGFASVGAGWSAMMLRLGIPIAGGAALATVASGGGHMTPEEYKASPGSAELDQQGIDRRSRVREWIGKKYEGAKNAIKGLLPGGAQAAEGTSGGQISAGRFSALKALIQKHESGGANYNSVYGNGRYGWPDKPVTQMTVREALAYQAKMRKQVGSSAFPVGRGQFVQTTLAWLAKQHGAFDEVMTPELQERFMDTLIKRRGRNLSGLREEWEGLKRASDGAILKAYDTDGSAKAPIQTGPRSSLGDPSPRVLGPESMGFLSPRTIGKMSDIAQRMDFTRMHAPTMGSGNSYSYNSGGNRSLTSTSTINFNIQGGSPDATANIAAREMERINQSSVRDVQAAMR